MAVAACGFVFGEVQYRIFVCEMSPKWEPIYFLSKLGFTCKAYISTHFNVLLQMSRQTQEKGKMLTFKSKSDATVNF